MENVQNENIHVALEYIPDDKVQYYFNAADVVSVVF